MTSGDSQDPTDNMPSPTDRPADARLVGVRAGSPARELAERYGWVKERPDVLAQLEGEIEREARAQRREGRARLVLVVAFIMLSALFSTAMSIGSWATLIYIVVLMGIVMGIILLGVSDVGMLRLREVQAGHRDIAEPGLRDRQQGEVHWRESRQDGQTTGERRFWARAPLITIPVVIFIPVVGHIILTMMILDDDLTAAQKLLWLLIVWLVPVSGPLLYLLLGQRKNRLLELIEESRQHTGDLGEQQQWHRSR